MKKIYLKVLSVIALIIVIIIVNYNSPSTEDSHIELFKHEKFNVYNGRVIEKYFENESLNYPTIHVENNYGIQHVL